MELKHRIPKLNKVILITFVLNNLALPVMPFLGRGTMTETHGDVFGIYCNEFRIGTKVWHHLEITREAARRVIVRYFKDIPPPRGVYNHRNGMTLEETFAEYFGRSQSPRIFLASLRDLVDAVIEADYGALGVDPRYHFSSEKFSESQALLIGRWARIVRAVQSQDFAAARYMMGLSMAAIQDFYSNTNWLENGNSRFNKDVGTAHPFLTNVALPNEPTCMDCNMETEGRNTCMRNLMPDLLRGRTLTSGYHGNAWIAGIRIEKPKGIGKCSHGGSRDPSRAVNAKGGINKELPTSCFSPHHQLHEAAAQQAIQATEHYLNLLRGVTGDSLFSQFLSLDPSPALVLVVDTTFSNANELAVVTNSMVQLVQEHVASMFPPSEYIVVPFGDPDFGPVIRSRRPEEVVNFLSHLNPSGGGDVAEVVMSAMSLALHAAPNGAHVFLFTDAPIKDVGMFTTVTALAHAKEIKIQPILTIPDPDEHPVFFNGPGLPHIDKYVKMELNKMSAEFNNSVEPRMIFQLENDTDDHAQINTHTQTQRNHSKPRLISSWINATELRKQPDINDNNKSVKHTVKEDSNISKMAADGKGISVEEKLAIRQPLLSPNVNSFFWPSNTNSSARIMTADLDRVQNQHSDVIKKMRVKRHGQDSHLLESLFQYENLAKRTGGHTVVTTSRYLEQTAIGLVQTSQQLPRAIILRESGVTSRRSMQIPVDSNIRELGISFIGAIAEAVIISPDGFEKINIKTVSNLHENRGIFLVLATPFMTEKNPVFTGTQKVGRSADRLESFSLCKPHMSEFV